MTAEQHKLEKSGENHQEPREWQTKKLDEVAHINLGQSPKGEYYNEEGDGPHFIQGSKNFGNKYPELERFCSEPKREAEEGDVLISVRAPVGPVNIAPENLCIGRGVTALRLDEGSNEYLYYYLKYFEDKWSQFADGTTFNSITKSDLQNLEIPYPPIKERNGIAFILSKIDEKIEVNNRINADLEEIAQSIFKSWFVDFEPHLEFKKSKIGEVPAEFEIAEIDDLVWSGRGYSYTSEYLDKDDEIEDSYPMINLKNVKEGGGFRTDGYKYYTEDQMKDRYKIDEGDLVVAITDLTQEGKLIGSPALIPELDEEMNIISQDVAKIVPEDVPREFLYHLFKTERFQEYSKSVATGTTVLHLSLTSIGEFQFALPSHEKLEEFAKQVRPIHEKKSNIIQENSRLRAIRDTILPKLMSGDIRVNDISLDDLEVDSEV